jgi:hypothetical protein
MNAAPDPGPSFGSAARRLAGLTARLFGWRPEEFWQATPAELHALLDPDASAPIHPLSRGELARLLERDP